MFGKKKEVSIKENTYFTLYVSADMLRYESKGEISYVTAHKKTVRLQSCFKGAAYSRAPLGSYQGKPSAFQTDPCIRDNGASAL